MTEIKLDQQKKYGIMISGGLDSAVLLNLLLKINPEIHIQPFTIPKQDGAVLYVDSIIDFFNAKFSVEIPKTILVGDPTVYHREQSKTAIRDVFKNYPVDLLFIAINQNPIELNSLPGAPQRDRHSTDPRICFPFVNMYKDQILEILFKENLDDIINLTHSCTEQKIGRCNRCWQCSERSWAFSKLGRIDTGTK